MTAVKVTAAQARRMGVDLPTPPSTKTVARAPYHTRCMGCGAVFTTQAAEDRHVDSVGGHNRFELVLTYTTAGRS
jgi:rRNA maturation endonuclease Nob1